MTTPHETIILALAIWRITYLITTDYILERPRMWLLDRLPEPVAYLLSCPVCFSVWVAAGTVTVWPHVRDVGWVQWAVLGAALAGVVALVETRLG